MTNIVVRFDIGLAIQIFRDYQLELEVCKLRVNSDE